MISTVHMPVWHIDNEPHGVLSTHKAGLTVQGIMNVLHLTVTFVGQQLRKGQLYAIAVQTLALCSR